MTAKNEYSKDWGWANQKTFEVAMALRTGNLQRALWKIMREWVRERHAKDRPLYPLNYQECIKRLGIEELKTKSRVSFTDIELDLDDLDEVVRWYFNYEVEHVNETDNSFLKPI